jgi:hypothetical protein
MHCGVVVGKRSRRDDALDQLPLAYSTALRLRDGGIADEVIAQCVGVEFEAMQAFMRLAEAKLAATGFGD